MIRFQGMKIVIQTKHACKFKVDSNGLTPGHLVMPVDRQISIN